MAANEKTVLDTIDDIIDISHLDTLYADLYLWRAKELLQEKMSPDSYRGYLRMERELSNLPNRIENAMMQGRWPAVQDMVGQMRSMKETVQRSSELLALAKKVYEPPQITIDPFSPGMQKLAGTTASNLPALRSRSLDLAAALMESDPGWGDFYAARQRELQSETVQPTEEGRMPRSSPGLLRQEALEAMEKGDYEKLQQVAGALSGGEGDGSTFGTSASGRSKGEAAVGGDLHFAFPEGVLEQARKLGLEAVRAESSVQEFVHLAPHIWNPTFADLESEQGRELHLSSLPIPADTPEALRSRIEMFVLHPFISSAGVRFLPRLVEEDLLVEIFDDPAAGASIPESPLLKALGLDRRNYLTRIQIEAVLAERAHLIVEEEIGLDPYQFRLVLIPPDLHLRVGRSRGWGNQAIWTHFDGYMLSMDGKMHALAGGDVRYGGIYDMVGVGRNYESDRIIARFAVVQRRRMARWKEL